MTGTLERKTFATSRTMDFFSEKELVTQTGHDVREWPLVFLKETVDNAIDACEEADIAPSVTVSADATGITVADNGPGIPPETVAKMLDFTVRVSSREAYVAPDRGAQGNALKTLVGMPYVCDTDHGRLSITANGVRHDITCRVDTITQEIVVDDHNSHAPDQPGTQIRIEWQEQPNGDGYIWPFDERHIEESARGHPSIQENVESLLTGFALFNPHLTISANWFDEPIIELVATKPEWRKWRPNQPTNALWYEQEHVERLIGAYIAHDRCLGRKRTVSEFLTLFDGLSGTKKRKEILEEVSLGRIYLQDLIDGDGFKSDVIARLLAAMKKRTKEVKPARLGIIGKDHLSTRFEQLGCDPEQFKYSKIAEVGDDGLPFVLESAFGWLGEDADDRRKICTGANWSAAIKNPFRSFGTTGEGLEAHLTERKAGANEPILFVLHLAHPRVKYTDRGKSAISIQEDLR